MKAAKQRAVEMLDLVGIPQARTRVDTYPHEFSGGMRQRAMIAMAIINNPDADHRRRADDGPRRHRAGADPGDAGRGQGRGQRGDHPDHPRPRRDRRHGRPGDGDVRRPASSSRAPSTTIFDTPRMPYTAGLLGSIPTVDARRRGADADQGCAAVADQRAARLPVLAPLPDSRDRRSATRSSPTCSTTDQPRPPRGVPATGTSSPPSTTPPTLFRARTWSSPRRPA